MFRKKIFILQICFWGNDFFCPYSSLSVALESRQHPAPDSLPTQPNPTLPGGKFMWYWHKIIIIFCVNLALVAPPHFLPGHPRPPPGLEPRNNNGDSPRFRQVRAEEEPGLVRRRRGGILFAGRQSPEPARSRAQGGGHTEKVRIFIPNLTPSNYSLFIAENRGFLRKRGGCKN